MGNLRDKEGGYAGVEKGREKGEKGLWGRGNNSRKEEINLR